MLKYAIAAAALLCAGEAAAHEVWIERADDGAARIYYGEPAENELERAGGGLDGINPTVFQGGAPTGLALSRHDDHLSAPLRPARTCA